MTALVLRNVEITLAYPQIRHIGLLSRNWVTEGRRGPVQSPSVFLPGLGGGGLLEVGRRGLLGSHFSLALYYLLEQVLRESELPVGVLL